MNKEAIVSKIDLVKAIPDSKLSDFIGADDPNIAVTGMNRVLTVLRMRHPCNSHADIDKARAFALESKETFLLMGCDPERTISWVKTKLREKYPTQTGHMSLVFALVVLLIVIAGGFFYLLPPEPKQASVTPVKVIKHSDCVMETGDCYPVGS